MARPTGEGDNSSTPFTPHPQTEQSMTPLKALIVEDSPVIRENLIATLEEMVSLQVVGTAEDEANAVAWLNDGKNACDLVIVDIFIKRGSGLGVLQKTHPAPSARKHVVLSNYATPDMRRRCLELGADEVFDKSNEIDSLIDYCVALVTESSRS
jgi:DNA-binding NarL/FixJ family response regulator